MMKTIRIIKYALIAAFVLVFALLCLTIGVKNNTIKTLKNKTEIIDSLQRTNKALGALDCITVNCTFEVNNKNIFAVSNTVATQIAKETATITRKEVLSAMDSLNNLNKLN